jgi:elongation factor Ts
MADIPAKDVKALRDATGAGMMDAKRALVATDGDFDAAAIYLRERGLGKAAERGDRDNSEGAVAVAIDPAANVAALVQLKCETDFVAKSPQFVSLVSELAEVLASSGPDGVEAKKGAVDDARIALKEHIELGRMVRFEAAEGNVLAEYLHRQSDRGKNGVLVELSGGTAELAHDIAVHIAFGKPEYRVRGEVPEEAVAAERAALEAETRNEGKPEAAIPKIVEGKLGGWYKRVPGGVLTEQPYAKDDKKTVAEILGGAQVVRFAQVIVGG